MKRGEQGNRRPGCRVPPQVPGLEPGGIGLRFQVTVRYGEGRQRYHLFTVDAPGIEAALEAAAGQLPEEVAREGNLVEIRPAVEPEGRSYLGEEE
jgi:hypothetical protein